MTDCCVGTQWSTLLLSDLQKVLAVMSCVVPKTQDGCRDTYIKRLAMGVPKGTLSRLRGGLQRFKRLIERLDGARQHMQ
jgi:hypothetical protein